MNDGSRCLPITRGVPAPATTAAITKSSSRVEIRRLRTTRANPAQLTPARITVITRYTCSADHSRGTAALSASHSGICGMLITNSITRWIASSTPPPK